MNDRWHVCIPEYDPYPGAMITDLLGRFNGEFTKAQFNDFVASYPRELFPAGESDAESIFGKLCKKRFIRPFQHPRENDPFKEFRGEFYNPNHGLNLLTGWPTDKEHQKRGETLL